MRLLFVREMGHGAQIGKVISAAVLGQGPHCPLLAIHVLSPLSPISSRSPYGRGIKDSCYPPLLHSIYAMDSKTFSFQNYTSTEFPFDPSRESPFSPLISKEDAPSPAGSSSPTSSMLTQHQYCLSNGKGRDRPWLTLRVSSRSPKSKFLPLFIGKDSISGTVELELSKPETVREMKVTVRVVLDIHHNRLTTK